MTTHNTKKMNMKKNTKNNVKKMNKKGVEDEGYGYEKYDE